MLPPLGNRSYLSDLRLAIFRRSLGPLELGAATGQALAWNAGILELGGKLSIGAIGRPAHDFF